MSSTQTHHSYAVPVPLRTQVKELYTPYYSCNDVVREGSRRFAALELPHTNSYTPCTPCFPSKDVVRAGSAQSNHPEPMLKNCTHLTKAVILWFEKVLGGSMRWNYPTLLFKHPAHRASPLKM